MRDYSSILCFVRYLTDGLEAPLYSKKRVTKYLGILIDDKLLWKDHIHHINLKIRKGIGMLGTLKNIVTKSTLRTVYYSFIFPYLDYNLVNWIFLCSKTGIYFWKPMYFLKTDIFVFRNRYVFLKTNGFLQNWYCNFAIWYWYIFLKNKAFLQN